MKAFFPFLVLVWYLVVFTMVFGAQVKAFVVMSLLGF